MWDEDFFIQNQNKFYADLTVSTFFNNELLQSDPCSWSASDLRFCNHWVTSKTAKNQKSDAVEEYGYLWRSSSLKTDETGLCQIYLGSA